MTFAHSVAGCLIDASKFFFMYKSTGDSESTSEVGIVIVLNQYIFFSYESTCDNSKFANLKKLSLKI